jgi:hypothetical protein
MKSIAGSAAVLVAVAVSAASAPRTVTYLPAADVAAAFGKGRPLVEAESYKVHASRREAAGQAEVHTRHTDIMYALTAPRRS